MPSMTPELLIAKIEAFALSHGIAPATVTSRAVGNSRLYRRMKDGGGCNVRVANRLIEFMAAHPVPALHGAPSSEKTAEERGFPVTAELMVRLHDAPGEEAA